MTTQTPDNGSLAAPTAKPHSPTLPLAVRASAMSSADAPPGKHPATRSATTSAAAPGGSGRYEADHITTLEGLEAVRRRPGMYIGGTGTDGLQHLLWELLDNSVDEAAAGFASRIEVVFHSDRSVEVYDDGRGIPVGAPPGRDISAVEVVFTELHAGGKFSGNGEGAYTSSGGLHGVGASVVNALSTKGCVEVGRDGFRWRMWFSERVAGKLSGGTKGRFAPTHEIEKLQRTKTTYTRVRFWPDWELFDEDAEFDFQVARERAQLMCHLLPGLRIFLTDARAGKKNAEPLELCSRKGLEGFVADIGSGSTINRVIAIHDEGSFSERVPVDGKPTTVERRCVVRAALQWNDTTSTQIRSFVNTIPTPAGGTHLAGFERALTRSVNDVLLAGTKQITALAKHGLERASKEDVQEGLAAALQVTFPEPQFRGQTKGELGTPGVQSVVYEIVKKHLTEWFEESGPRSNVTALRSKIIGAMSARAASRRLLEDKRKASRLGSSGLPDKLADCRIHGRDSELIIVEGDSAAGPAKAGRNAAKAAILPLRGKIVNAGKSSIQQVLDNAEAQALFRSVGAGVKSDFDIEAARYGRIVILCDADVDGSHIRCLLLTLIYHYMRPMLEHGRVFAAQPPLYTTKVGGNTHRAFSEAERDAIARQLARGKRKIENIRWQRFKGLGEMNTDELAHCALDPATRILRQITLDDAAEAERILEVLMGSEVAPRRDYLMNRGGLIAAEALDY